MFVIIDLKTIVHTEFVDIVICPLKAKIVEPERWLLLSKHSIHDMQEEVFPMQSMPWLC
jgi:hypothetical protein